MIEVDFIVEKCEMRSDIHEITAETEKPFQDHFGRTTFVILGLLLQIAFFFSIFRWLGNYIHFVYITYVLVSSSVVIAILNRPMDSSFKMAWIIPVLLIPISALSYMCLCRSSSRQGRWQDGSICLLKNKTLSCPGPTGAEAAAGSQCAWKPSGRLYEPHCRFPCV